MENTVLNEVLNYSDEHTTLINKFNYSIETIVRLADLQNISVKPFSEDGIKKISSMPYEELQRRNLDLLRYVTAIQEASISNPRVSNKDMTKNILNFLKFSTPNEFLNSITDKDIVEIYNPDGIQIFRNLKFYETTTYSLSDLLAHEWHELYYRSSKITEKLMGFAQQIFENDSNEIVYEMNEVPVHLIKEIKASPIQLCEIRFKKIAPVIDRAGRKAGLIVNCQARSLLSDLSHEGIDFI